MKERLRAALQARSGNRALRFLYKLWQLRRRPRAALARPGRAARFLLRSREVSNFTYENVNEGEMATAIAAALGVDLRTVENLLDELDRDEELREMLAARLRPNRLRENEPRYGYRRISYCVTRLRRPGSVVECGTHDGLAASLILRALERNAADGSEGLLHTFDLTPDAGWLIPDPLRGRLDLTIGDVEAELGPVLAEHGADYFIEDFGHDYPGKGELIQRALEAGGGRLVVLTECDDDPALATIAGELGGRYEVFEEQPAEHWWPGHQWGLAELPR